MTHDELLAKLDEKQKLWWAILAEVNIPKNEREDFWVISALRAVVELHKPVQSYMFEEEACSHCSSEEDRSEILYPCPTIQAIEEQLK